MTDAHVQSSSAMNAEKAGAKRNDQASEGERRSFKEPGREPGSEGAVTRSGAFEQARQGLEQAGARGLWGPSLISRQWEPLLRMQTDMIRWFDEVWRETGAAWQPLQRFGALSAAPMFGLPPADVKETSAAYTLSVELPGLAREDVEIAIEADMLLISGHKQEDRQQAGTALRLSERRFGRFERSFPLPADVRREAVEAAFRDGVLTITMPRTGALAAGKRSQVQIKG
jgi:HSP20 family protein